MNQRSTLTAGATRCAALVVLVLALAACGGGGGSSSNNTKAKSTPSATPSATATATSTSSGSSQAVTQIKQNWETFFNGKTPTQKKIGLLQNGQRFAPVIDQQAKSTLAQGTTAKVTSVVVTSPTAATVAYNVLINGTPALSNQSGQAVLESGVWKVSVQSFCQLLSLQGGSPQGCQRAAPIPSPTPSS